MTTEQLSKGEQTRALILLKAHELFLKQGFHATSMRQIAKEAEIAVGGIYNHFSTKEEIFQAVFLSSHPYNHILPLILSVQGDNVEDLLRDIATRMIDGLTATPGFLNLLFIDIVEFQSKNTTDLIEKNLPYFDQIYQRAISSSGPQLRSLPPLMVVRTFFGLFFSFYFTGFFLHSSPNLPAEINDNAFEYFLDIFLHGVINKDKL